MGAYPEDDSRLSESERNNPYGQQRYCKNRACKKPLSYWNPGDYCQNLTCRFAEPKTVRVERGAKRNSQSATIKFHESTGNSALDELVSQLAQHFDCTLAEVLSGGKQATPARHVAVFVLRKILEKSCIQTSHLLKISSSTAYAERGGEKLVQRSLPLQNLIRRLCAEYQAHRM